MNIKSEKNPLDFVPSDLIINFYEDEEFLSRTEEMSDESRFSVALAAQRFSDRAEGSSIKEALDLVLEERERFEAINIFSEGRSIIAVSNDEESTNGEDRFDDTWVEPISQNVGIPKENIKKYMGPESTKEILEGIEQSNEATTIVFNGHGSTSKIYLGTDDGITVDQIVEAYVKKGLTKKTGQDVLLIGSCYSNNFARNFYALAEEKGLRVEDMPVIVTSANFNQYGYTSLSSDYNDYILNSLAKQSKNKGIITGRSLSIAEEEAFINEDMSVFVPSKKLLDFLKSHNTGTVDPFIEINTNSRDNRLENEQNSEPHKTDTNPLPDSVFEVGENAEAQKNEALV
jgi:hypothetical protein